MNDLRKAIVEGLMLELPISHKVDAILSAFEAALPGNIETSEFKSKLNEAFINGRNNALEEAPEGYEQRERHLHELYAKEMLAIINTEVLAVLDELEDEVNEFGFMRFDGAITQLKQRYGGKEK